MASFRYAKVALFLRKNKAFANSSWENIALEEDQRRKLNPILLHGLRFMCNLAVALLEFQHQKGFLSIPKRKRKQPAWFVHNRFQGQKLADPLFETFCVLLSTPILPVWERILMFICGGRVAVLKTGCLKIFSKDFYDVLLFPRGFEGRVFVKKLVW